MVGACALIHTVVNTLDSGFMIEGMVRKIIFLFFYF